MTRSERSRGHDADVAIVRAGSAGAAAALTAAGAGLDVVAFHAPGAEEPDRPEYLPPQAGPILRKLGLFPAAAPSAMIRPAGGIRSHWQGTTHDSRNDPTQRVAGQGWVVSRNAVAEGLRRLAAGHGADIRPVRATAVAYDGRWRLVTASGRLSAAFLIEASGRSAFAARRAGAVLATGPSRIAMAAVLPADGAAPATPPILYVESFGDDWWYSLRGPMGEWFVGLVTSGRRADLATLRGSSGFQKALARTVWTRQRFPLDRLAETQPPVTVLDSRMSRLDRFYGTAWIAVGDAALAFDPLASQGLFNALASGYFGARAACAHLAGDADALPVYGRLLDNTFRRTAAVVAYQYGLLAAAPAGLTPG